MPSVAVNFFGICTHLSKNQPNAPESPIWGHRFVLPRANGTIIKQHEPLVKWGVNSHVSRLQIAASDITNTSTITNPGLTSPVLRWLLEGVTLTIANPANQIKNLSADDMNNLQEFANQPLEAPGVVATAGDPLVTCAYFDFPTGTLTVSGSVTATVTTLTVQTDGDPVLLATPFAAGMPVTILLRDGAQISVSNFPDADSLEPDKNADFLLHYLTGSVFPSNPSFPKEPGNLVPLVTYNEPIGWRAAMNKTAFAGPGCSNSNYP
jgi:hypothetical protein